MHPAQLFTRNAPVNWQQDTSGPVVVHTPTDLMVDPQALHFDEVVRHSRNTDAQRRVYAARLHQMPHALRAAGMSPIGAASVWSHLRGALTLPEHTTIHPFNAIRAAILRQPSLAETLTVVVCSEDCELVLNGHKQNGMLMALKLMDKLIDWKQFHAQFPDQFLPGETGVPKHQDNILYISGHLMADPSFASEVLIHELSHYADFLRLNDWMEANAKKKPKLQPILYKKFTSLSRGRRVIDPAFLHFFLETSAHLGAISVRRLLQPENKAYTHEAIAELLDNTVYHLDDPRVAAVARELGITQGQIMQRNLEEIEAVYNRLLTFCVHLSGHSPSLAHQVALNPIFGYSGK